MEGGYFNLLGVSQQHCCLAVMLVSCAGRGNGTARGLQYSGNCPALGFNKNPSAVITFAKSSLNERKEQKVKLRIYCEKTG